MFNWLRKRSGPDPEELRQVRNDLADLQSEMRRLKAEWLDMYEKLTRRDERMRKREARQDTNEQLTIPEAGAGRKAALWARARALGGGNGVHP